MAAETASGWDTGGPHPVMMPSVPSLPTKMRASGRNRRTICGRGPPLRSTHPSAVTTVNAMIAAHGAIAPRWCPGAVGGHAAQAGIGAGIDRKEQPVSRDLLVELLARDAGLHRDRQVFALTASTWFICDRFRLMPPWMASRPSSDEPASRGIKDAVLVAQQ